MWAEGQLWERSPALLLWAQIPRSNFGQVALISPRHRVTSQKADIMRHTLEEAVCWLQLWCWTNIIGNSHLSPGSFNNRALSSCLVPQCSHLPHWFCHQQRLANCDWMPASYTCGQSSYARRHPTCWDLWQRSYSVSSTPCHGAWISAPPSSHPFTWWNARQLKSRHAFVPAPQLTVHLTTTTYVRQSGRITNGIRSGWITLRDSVLSSPTLAPTLPEWLCQEQQVHGLTFLDNETIKWLLNTHASRSSAA